MHDIDQYLIDWQFLYVHMWFFNAWSTSKNLKSPRDVGNKRWKNFWSNKNCNSWKWMAYIIMVFVFYMGWVPPISDCPFHVDRIVQFYLELLSHSTVQEWRCMNHVFFCLYCTPSLVQASFKPLDSFFCASHHRTYTMRGLQVMLCWFA